MNADIWNTLWEAVDDFERRIEGNWESRFYTRREYEGAREEIEAARVWLQSVQESAHEAP